MKKVMKTMLALAMAFVCGGAWAVPVSATPKLLINFVNNIDIAVDGWYKHYQNGGKYLGGESGITSGGFTFKTSADGNFYPGDSDPTQDYQNGSYVDIYGATHASLMDEVKTSLGLANDIGANVYKSGLINGGYNNHTATIGGLDPEKQYVVYCGFGRKYGSRYHGFRITTTGYTSVSKFEYVTTVAGTGTSVATQYTEFQPETQVRVGDNGLMIVRATGIVPTNEGTIVFKLDGSHAGMNFLAVAEIKSIEKGDSVVWSSFKETGNKVNFYTRNSATLNLPISADTPEGTKIAISAIKFATPAGRTYQNTITIDGKTSDTKETVDFTAAEGGDTTYNKVVVYKFTTNPLVVNVGTSYTITIPNAGGVNGNQFSTIATPSASPIDIAIANTKAFAAVEGTIYSIPGSACTATLNANTTFANISYNDASMIPSAVTPVELTINGNVTVTVDAAAEIASLKLKGSGNFTLTGSAMLTLDEINATELTGSVTLDAGTAIPTTAIVKAGSAAFVYNYSGSAALNLTHLAFSGNFTKGGTGTANLNKDIASGKTVTVAAGTLNYTNGSQNRGFKGNLVVQKDATFVSQKGDVMYWDSPTETTIDVYGTLALGRNRWTLNNNKLTIHAGGTITGHTISSQTDGGGNINYIAAKTIYMSEEGGTGDTAEISAIIAPQGGATTFDVPAGKTLILSAADSCNDSNRRNTFAKSGAGTLKITGNYKTLDGFSASAGTVTVTNTTQMPSTNGETGSTIGAGATLDLSEVTDAAGTIFNAKLTIASGAKLKFAADTHENTVIPLHAASIVPSAAKVENATIIVGDTEKTATLFFDTTAKTVAFTTEALATEYALTEADKTAITTGCTANGQVFKYVPGTKSFTETATITGAPDGYVVWTEGGIVIYAAKKTNSISIKINPRSATEGTIAKTDANVGGFPVAGVFWNHTKIFNDNGAGTTEILKVKDGNGVTLEDTRVFYYMPNSYLVNGGSGISGRNKQTTGNGKLTYSYFDDSTRISSPTFPYVISQDGFDNCELPTTPAGKLHWEIGISGMPYQVFDLYIYQASDQTASTISLLPIAVKANDGEWKYFAGDGQGSTIAATESSRWNGAAYCDAETMTEGTNYIRYRLSPAALGLEAGQRIEKIYLSHPNVSNGRLGLAGIQLVQVDNDGFYSRKADEGEMTAEAKHWTAEGSWKNSSGTAIDWPTDGGTAYVNINGDEVAEITINDQIRADLVTVKNADSAQDASFKFLTTESLDHVATVDPNAPILNAPVDATGFHGNLYLQGRIGGQVSLNSGVTVNFVSDVADAETTAYPYTFAGTINPIKKNGPGSFLVPSTMYKDPFNVLAGSIRYDNAEAATLSGSLSGVGKAVKTGAGTLTFTSSNLPTGGFEVREGTVKLIPASRYDFWNGTARAVSIANGATLDINGYEGFKADVTMAQGATLASEDANRDLGASNASLHAIALNGAAAVRAVGDFGLLANNYNATTLELNGNTLTKTGAGNFFFCRTTSSTAGTIAVSEGALSTVNSYDVSFPNVDVTLAAGTTLSISQALTLKSVAVNGAVTFAGTGKLTAAMTFAMGASITSTRELDTTGMTVPTGYELHKEMVTEGETTSYVYTLVRTQVLTIQAASWSFDSFTYNGEPIAMIAGDTVDIALTGDGDTEWHATDGTDKFSNHPILANSSMNWKWSIKRMTIGSGVRIYAYGTSGTVINDGAVIDGAGTFSLNGGETLTVNGSATISCTITLNTSVFKLGTATSTLTVSTALGNGKVTSGVDGYEVKKTVNNDSTVTYSLIIPAATVVTDGVTTYFESIQAAIDSLGQGGDITTIQIVGNPKIPSQYCVIDGHLANFGFKGQSAGDDNGVWDLSVAPIIWEGENADKKTSDTTMTRTINTTGIKYTLGSGYSSVKVSMIVDIPELNDNAMLVSAIYKNGDATQNVNLKYDNSIKQFRFTWANTDTTNAGKPAEIVPGKHLVEVVFSTSGASCSVDGVTVINAPDLKFSNYQPAGDILLGSYAVSGNTDWYHYTNLKIYSATIICGDAEPEEKPFEVPEAFASDESLSEADKAKLALEFLDEDGNVSIPGAYSVDGGAVITNPTEIRELAAMLGTNDGTTKVDLSLPIVTPEQTEEANTFEIKINLSTDIPYGKLVLCTSTSANGELSEVEDTAIETPTAGAHTFSLDSLSDAMGSGNVLFIKVKAVPLSE